MINIINVITILDFLGIDIYDITKTISEIINNLHSELGNLLWWLIALIIIFIRNKK